VPSYKTKVIWKGGRSGHLVCGNGPEMDFAAPPTLYGEQGVLTPEDAFVAAVNTCFHMMLIWAFERSRVELVSYECEAEGIVRDLLDRTSVFETVILRPEITVRKPAEEGGIRPPLEETVRKCLKSAEKFSLVAQSIKSRLIVEPEITIESRSKNPGE
jgi:organic hydroperoxide reductase OsmC/OhrA